MVKDKKYIYLMILDYNQIVELTILQKSYQSNVNDSICIFGIRVIYLYINILL